MIRLIEGDCLEKMKHIEDKSIDMVCTDPPYGTTNCKWDSIIPLDLMWKQLKRIIKPNNPILLTGTQPFTSILISSNLKMFKHEWVWDKVNKYTGSLQANRQRLRRHEDIIIFAKNPLKVYNKQFREGKPFISKQTKGHGGHNTSSKPHTTINTGKHNPCSILEIKADNKKELGLHPTQKPIELMEYFIKTYSQETETILDFTAGSFTTAIACMNLNRKFIGIEKENKYFEIGKKRVLDHFKTLSSEQQKETLPLRFN